MRLSAAMPCANRDGQVWYGMPNRTEPNKKKSGAISTERTGSAQIKVGDYGLRGEALSPMETLAQSVSTIAPTSTPAATIPLVAALAGNGTWLAYLLASVAILLVAWCISRFARYSASPGSLYTYAAMILPPWLGAVAAWSLLLAYIATGSSVIGGFYHYANLLLVEVMGRAFSGAALALIVTGVSVWIAWRDVKISARLMLWIEALSLLVILVVVALVLVRHGLHLDPGQLHVTAVTGGGLRLGLVLALFSFVGFESATTLGDSERGDRWRILYRVGLFGSAGLPRGRTRPGHEPGPHARSSRRRSCASAGNTD